MIIDLPPGAPRLTLRWNSPQGARDVVGHLVAANHEWFVLLPEDRPAVWVPRAEASGVKEVPERTVLPASPPEAVERVLDRMFPGLRRARLGGWVLREGHWRTGRANSVLAVGDPGLPFAEALEAAEEWYGRRPQLQIVLGGVVEDEVRAHGLEVKAETLVVVARIDDLAAAPLGDAAWEGAPGAGWRALSPSSDDLYLEELTSAPAHYLTLEGLGAGRVALWGGWALLSSLKVAPGRRGEGWGRGLTRALVQRAKDEGARTIALQVEAGNDVARRLYEAEGFVEHHRYGYAVRPA